MVGGLCSMLPYGTGIYCYAFIPPISFLLIFLKSGIGKSDEKGL